MQPRFYPDFPLSEAPIAPADRDFVEVHEPEDLADDSVVRNTGITDSRTLGTYGFSGSLAARASGRASFSASRPATGEEGLRSFLAVAAQKETHPIGHWRRGFPTVRELRSHPELRRLREDPDGALEAVEAVAPEGWFEETFGPEDPQLVFLYQWSKVRLDLDEDPLEDAIRKAEEDPVPFPGRLTHICRLIGSIAAHRSLLTETFALPQPQLAEMTGILQGTICKAIQELTRRGILKPEGEKGRAKLYSYHGPFPKFENKPAPILLAPEDAKGEEPVQTPRESEKKPEPETFTIPQAGGRKPWPVSPGDLERLQAKYAAVNVADEIRKLLQKIEVTGEEIRYAPGVESRVVPRPSFRLSSWRAEAGREQSRIGPGGGGIRDCLGVLTLGSIFSSCFYAVGRRAQELAIQRLKPTRTFLKRSAGRLL
jgi:hypothetical protein